MGCRLVVTLVVAGVVLVRPAAAAAQAPVGDSVTGSGVAGTFWGQFEIDASSGPSGENPTGQVRTRALNGLVSGPVTCLAVRGNIATLNIEAVDTPGTVVTLEVTDGAVAGVPDVIVGAATGFGGRLPTDCSPLMAGVREEVSSGDIVVIDAPPLPTTTDQCKGGGWRSFGNTFKNQGDCVSFVAAGGRRPPAGQ
jgi:hypothetical protein